MLRPKSIKTAETDETKALSHKGFAALNDKTLPDTQADLIIDECNRMLAALGMPAGGLIVHRAEYRKAYPSFNV